MLYIENEIFSQPMAEQYNPIYINIGKNHTTTTTTWEQLKQLRKQIFSMQPYTNLTKRNMCNKKLAIVT